MSISIELPLPYYQKKGRALMTLNVYRNAHHHTQSAFKRMYGQICLNALFNANIKKTFTCVSIEFVLHTLPTKGKPIKADPYRGSVPKNIDLSNALAVVDKTFCDVVVTQGGIPSDTITHIQRVIYESKPWATRDYITVVITEITPKTDPRRS